MKDLTVGADHPSGDPLMVGLIGLCEAIPAIGVSLWAGHLADKYNRRSILIGCALTMLACALALLTLAYKSPDMGNASLISGIFVVIFVTGVARGFFSPTNFAFLPQLVGRENLSNAITWNSSTWEVASIGGLGLGGVLYGIFGVKVTFSVMAILYILSLIFLLKIKPRPVPEGDHSEPALVRIREGLRFVFNNPLIINAIALDLFAVLFGGAVAMIPFFNDNILKVGPEWGGFLRAAMSLGAITMAFVLARLSLGKSAGRVLLYCVAGFGLCIIGFGLSRWYWLSFAFLFFAGVFDEVSVFIRASLVQHLTPDHMKGRVSSVSSIFITSSNEIGAFESGLAARYMGTVPSVIFGGFMTLLIVGIIALKAPRLRNLDLEKLKED
jgi:MFS family permease